MRKFLAVAMSAALVVPAPVLADNCRAVVFRQQNVQHAPQHVVCDQNQIIVPRAFQVQVAAPFYMGVADDYRQANFAAQVAAEYAKIVDLQRQQFNLGQGLPNGQLTLAVPSFQTKITTKIGAILAKNCAVCHSPTGKQPAPDLSVNPDQISELVRLKSFAAAARGTMPKAPHPPLPQDEFNELGAWSALKPTEVIPAKQPAAPMLPNKEELPEPKILQTLPKK